MSMLLNGTDFSADEALIAVARESLNAGNRIQAERVIYYRLPQRTPDGGLNKQAGWIVWGDTQQSARISKMARGILPLMRGQQPVYGNIGSKRRDDDPDGPFELWGPWGVILSQPGGMEEFPLSQILAFHWYDAERLRRSLNGSIPPNMKVRNGMVLWPQLNGERLKIFSCYECSDWRTLQAVFLARHLRIWHDYDQADILAFGQQHGVDFSAELNRDKGVMQEMTFESPAEDESVEDEPVGFSFEVARPQRGRSQKGG